MLKKMDEISDMFVNLGKMALFFLFLSVSMNALASDGNTTTGRYLSVNNKPLREQQDLLSQTFQVHFPKEVETVGDAIHYLLRYSGYSLVDEKNQSLALRKMLKKPLPLVDRNFGLMSLRDGLSTLMGPAFTLVSDPLNREVDFKLRSNMMGKKG